MYRGKRFILVRHGKTRSTVEGRYPADPGEPLCDEGIQELKRLSLPPAEAVFTAPALRCRETAELLYPGAEHMICPFEEINFGVFAGKTAAELASSAEYLSWLESGCMGDIPGGEDVSAFKQRCRAEFIALAERLYSHSAAVIMHAGNIMAILEGLGFPPCDFFSYKLGPGDFYYVEYTQDKRLQIIQ
jgi:alpha-ribazole phosphatase